MSNMPTAMPAAGDVVALIERFKDLDSQKLRDVIEMYVKMQDRAALAEFNDAMSAAHSEIVKVERDKPNPLFKSRYSSLEAQYDACEPALKKYGVLLRFGSEPTSDPNVMRLSCILSKGLYTEKHTIDVAIAVEGPKGGRPAMSAAQARGSVMTYARKYLMQMVLNLVSADDITDDDGNAGGRPPRSGLMPDHIRREMQEKIDPKTGEVAQNGNGNGGPSYEERKAQWLDELQARMDAADTQAEAEKILKEPAVENCERVFAKDADTVAKIQDLKRIMIARIWQGDPGTNDPQAGDHLV